MSVGTSISGRLFGFCVLTLALGGCGDGGASPTSPVPTATVEFVYLAATTTAPEVAARFPSCVSGVNVTHIHPGWRGFAAVALNAAAPGRWSISFSDVPVGSEQRIRISDPNACTTDPNGASTEGVFANDVPLTRVVDTPGNGIEPGLAFSVSPNGTVTP